MTLAEQAQEGSTSTEPERPRDERRFTLGFALLGTALLLLLVTLDALAPGGRGFLQVTRKNADSICYFSVAHSLLFDRDFDLTNQLAVMVSADAPLPRGAQHWIAVVPRTGKPGSPFAIGYSLLGLPFLAAGTAIDALSGGRGDGFGVWAERLFVSANIVYLTIGLWFLHRWQLSLGRRWCGKRRAVGLAATTATLALLPATALGYYAFTVMSHTVSFMTVALFLFVWWERRDSLKILDWLWIGGAAGLMTVCRWQNAIFPIVVVIWELSERKGARPRAWWLGRIASVAVCASIFVPQSLEWQAIYGRWFGVPQGPGFLSWPPTKIAHVLFSSHNGFFFTTPAVIAGVVGLLWGLRRERRLFGALLTAMALQVVVVGSSPSWSGWAFAMRLLINTLPAVAVGWLYLFLGVARRLKLATLAWIALGSVFTILSAAQWRYEFVPRNRPLTFAEAFTDKLRLGEAYRRHVAMKQAHTSAELLTIRDRHGTSAVLMERLKKAYEAEGREQDRAEAEAWLERRRARCLF
jgi:hypothetical protein